MTSAKNIARTAMLFFSLLFITVGGVLFLHATQAQQQATHKVNTYLEEYTTQQALSIQGRVREHLVGLTTLASYIGNEQEISLEKTMPHLRSRSVNKYYKRLGVIMPDGSGAYTDASYVHPSQRQVVLRALQGRSTISAPIMDPSDGSMITMMAAPIYKNNKVCAVLSAHFPSGFFQPQPRQTLLGDQSLLFLMDAHGFVLERSFAPLPGDENNFLLYLSKTASAFSKAPQLIADDLRTGKSGVENYTNTAGTHHIAYAPVGEGSWHAVSILPEKALTEIRQEIRQPRTIGLGILLTGMILLMPALFGIITTKRAAGRRVHLTEQRFEALSSCISGGFLCCKQDRQQTIVDISPGLLKLLGYTREDIRTLYNNEYFRLLLDEDRPCLVNVLSSAGDNTVSTEYRLLCKDGSHVWVKDKRKPGKEAKENLWYAAIVDASERLALIEERNHSAQKLDSLLECSDSHLFTYAVGSGDVQASAPLSAVYNIHEAPFALANSCNDICAVHPDDMDTYSTMRGRMLSGSASHEATLRIKDSTGRYNWHSFRLRGIAGKMGCAYVVGCLSHVPLDHDPSHVLTDQDFAHDSLTGLLTQESFRARFNDYSTKVKDAKGALCLVDVDGFRKIKNDYSMEVSDALLQELSKVMRGIFRPVDILGRLGHDHFPIFIRDLEDRHSILAKLEELRSFAEQGFYLNDSPFPFSVSVGIAFYPVHGRSFERLLYNADKALTTAKKKGGGGFAVFGG